MLTDRELHKMATTGPGKSYRKGLSLLDLADMFPDEKAATEWFEYWYWLNEEMACMRCGSPNCYRVKSGKPMPYRCRDCKKYFSLKTGTAMEASNIPLRKWAYAIYLEMTSLKGVSSMKLHRDLKISQSAAWFMKHRIREGLAAETRRLFYGPVEADECYIGGLEKNKAKHKRTPGRGPSSKQPVVGLKDRDTNSVAARVVDHLDAETLQGFVDEHAVPGAQLYTDDTSAYKSTDRPHETVKHSVGEYVRGMAHTNGVESFWAMLRRAYHGTYHKISLKHLQRYIDEFAGRHNLRELDTIDQMHHVVAGMVGRRLMYRDLVSD